MLAWPAVQACQACKAMVQADCCGRQWHSGKAILPWISARSEAQAFHARRPVAGRLCQAGRLVGRHGRHVSARCAGSAVEAIEFVLSSIVKTRITAHADGAWQAGLCTSFDHHSVRASALDGRKRESVLQRAELLSQAGMLALVISMTP